MNTISTVETGGGEATQPQAEQSNNAGQQGEVEKGSGYGPPNEGSGESISEEDLSPDGQPIPGSGTAEDKPQNSDT